MIDLFFFVFVGYMRLRRHSRICLTELVKSGLNLGTEAQECDNKKKKKYVRSSR